MVCSCLTTPLPGFSFLPDSDDDDFLVLHRKLWKKPLPTKTLNLSQLSDADKTAMRRQWPDACPEESFEYIDLLSDPQLATGPKVQGLVDSNHAAGAAPFLLRPDYQLFIGALNRDVSRGLPPVRKILTGQSGIRTSLCLYYILYQRLAAGSPTFFQPYANIVYYFCDDGVSCATSHISPLKFGSAQKALARRAWALVDVDDPAWCILPSSWHSLPQVVVWASEPAAQRFRLFCEKMFAQLWFMLPWCPEEIAAQASLVGVSVEQAVAAFKIVGPVARTLFKPSRILENVKARMEKAASQMATEKFSTVVRWCEDGNQVASMPDRLFCVSPLEQRTDTRLLQDTAQPMPEDVEEEPDDGTSKQPRTLAARLSSATLSRKKCGVSFLSPVAVEVYIKALKERQQSLSAFWYSMKRCDPTSRAAAGPVLECMLHDWFSSSSPTPIETREKLFNAPGDVVPRYLHGSPPNLSFSYTDERPLYLRPATSNFPIIDAALCSSNNELYLFHLTTCSANLFDPLKLKEVIKSLNTSARVNLRTIIFAVIGVVTEDVASVALSARVAVEKSRGARGILAMVEVRSYIFDVDRGTMARLV